MCGIIGIVGNTCVVDRIVGSLERLEYRGYDSTGIATHNNNDINVYKVAGKVKNLKAEVKKQKADGNTGIGHTRWATHGAPIRVNAHPFKSNSVCVVHNGIIENHREIKEKLLKAGYVFESSTDTETIPHLITHYLQQGIGEIDAVRTVVKELEGTYAIAVIFGSNEDLLIGAKKGSPLAVGLGNGEMYLGSDAYALSQYTSKIVYLEDGEIAVLHKDKYFITNSSGQKIDREVKNIISDSDSSSKGDFPHFMIKEIFEQPQVLARSFSHYYDVMNKKFKLDIDFTKIERLYIVACGTSYNAAHIAKYWFESVAKIPCEIDIASEFRYRDSVLLENSYAIFISQSGETADTLAALKFTKETGIKSIALVNVTESSIANNADYALPINAGFEIGVASTKAFTCQLMALSMICLYAASTRGKVSSQELSSEIYNIHRLPDLISEVLNISENIKFIAEEICSAKSMIFVGRGAAFPLADEGALKMKELSYIHAEGFAAGELKHGPIALIDEEIPIIALSPNDKLYAKTASNLSEIYARSGKIIALTDKAGRKDIEDICFNVIELPESSMFTMPIIYAIPLQLLSYHTANALKLNIDQPRNLAKSVTVE